MTPDPDVEAILASLDPAELEDFRAKLEALPPITVLDLPNITENLGNLFRARHQEMMEQYLMLLVFRSRGGTATVAQLYREVMDVMDDETKAWWGAPCDCGILGKHSHN